MQASTSVADAAHNSAGGANSDHPVSTSAKGSRTSHYWVCSSPFFETVLFACFKSSGSIAALVYDADGALINQLQLSVPAKEVACIEVQSLLEACKLEGGLKHAHLVIDAPDDAVITCRIQSRDGAALLGSAKKLSLGQSVFFPISCSDERSFMLACVNEVAMPMPMRCRLFFGKRTPEISLVIPPLGARLLSVSAEFSEYLSIDAGKQVQAYLRLGAREQGSLGVHLIERVDLGGDKFFYGAVS